MKYSKKIVDEIVELYADPKNIIVDICRAVGIHHHTWYEWKEKKPEFSARLEKAEDDRYNKIKVIAESALLKAATGYDYEESKIEMVDTKGGKAKIKSKTVYKKHAPPNPTAAIFLSKNLNKRLTDKQIVEHSGEVTIGKRLLDD